MLYLPCPDEVQEIVKNNGLKCKMKGLMGKLLLKLMFPLMSRFLMRAPLKRSVLHFTDEEHHRYYYCFKGVRVSLLWPSS